MAVLLPMTTGLDLPDANPTPPDRKLEAASSTRLPAIRAIRAIAHQMASQENYVERILRNFVACPPNRTSMGGIAADPVRRSLSQLRSKR